VRLLEKAIRSIFKVLILKFKGSVILNSSVMQKLSSVCGAAVKAYPRAWWKQRANRTLNDFIFLIFGTKNGSEAMKAGAYDVS
jgi:hypothetical protein